MKAAPLLALGTLLLSAVSGGCIDTHTEAVRGSELYRRYCASCHGVDGHGDGPLAASLSPKPADLTTLAKRHGGKFDETAVMMMIDGRLLIAQHGPRDMPVWGAIFAEQHVGKPFAMYGPTLDARALADYLRTIQAN
ncbi:MAG TPA: cytochrome C [Deltaproteobacteria bacterium]|jgi:mono/diheme cytochrome c family protein|nr:cytochrome C [Deltaproteobacteria bacterium]